MSRSVRYAVRAVLSASTCVLALPVLAQQSQFNAPPVPGPYPLTVTPATPPATGGLTAEFVAPPGSMRVPYWLQQVPAGSPIPPAGDEAVTAPAARAQAPATQGYGVAAAPGFFPGPMAAQPRSAAPLQGIAPQGWPYAQQGYLPPGYGYPAQVYPPQGYAPQGYVPPGFPMPGVPGWGPQPGWGAPGWSQQGQGRGQ